MGARFIRQNLVVSIHIEVRRPPVWQAMLAAELLFATKPNHSRVGRTLQLLPSSVSYRRFKYSNVYVFERFELNAIPRHARPAYLFAIRFCQVRLILDTKDVDRDSSFVCTDTNLIKVSVSSISIFHDLKSIADIRIRDGFIVTVFAIQEPQFTIRHYIQNDAVQLLHVAAFWLRLTGNILFDLSLDVHIKYEIN